MKKVLSLVFSLSVLSGVYMYSQSTDNTSATTSKEDIVLNMKMIEKYQNAEYSENQLYFTDLASIYSFETVKEIAAAYKNGEIERTAVDEIKTYLAKVEQEKTDDKKLDLCSEKKILAAQK
jgi:hypothetical protein